MAEYVFAQLGMNWEGGRGALVPAFTELSVRGNDRGGQCSRVAMND